MSNASDSPSYGATGFTGPTGETGSTGFTGATGFTSLPSYMTPMESQCPPPPDVLTMSDLLSDQSVLLAKEEADKALLETIGIQSVANLRPKLVEWVLKGRPDGFPVLTLNICPPSVCSDGVSRNLADYISFCSGKTIQEHVALLQAKLPDIQVSFANFGGAVCVTVLKA